MNNRHLYFSNKRIHISTEGVLSLDAGYRDHYQKLIPLGEVTSAKSEWTPPWIGAGFFALTTAVTLYFGFWIVALLSAAIAGSIWKLSYDGKVHLRKAGSDDSYFTQMNYSDAQKAVAAISKAQEDLRHQNEEILNLDLEVIDVGTPEERYKRAGEFWDKKDDASQQVALQIFDRLTSEGVALENPYRVYSTILAGTDPRANSEKLVYLCEKLVEIAPENSDYLDALQMRYFTRAKVLWDDEKDGAAFEYYMKGLRIFLERGGVLSNDSPLVVRIAFRACKMFSKNALEAGNPNLGVAFMDWCETAGVDMNEDIDVSDAAPARG